MSTDKTTKTFEKEPEVRVQGVRRLYTRTIPLFLVSFITGLGILLYFGTGIDGANGPIALQVKAVSSELQTWGVILAGFSFLYGYISVILLHSRRLYRRRDNRSMLYGSGVFLVAVALVFGVIITSPGNVNSASIGLLNVYLFSYIDSGMKTDWVFLPYLNMKLFKLTSITAGIMMISYVIYALRSSPLVAVSWPPIMAIGDWINFIPQNATIRAATACAGISAVFFCLRALVMREPGVIEMEA